MHLYAHSRRDGLPGFVYLLVNNSTAEPVSVTLPAPCRRYTLSAKSLRAAELLLNGAPLGQVEGCGLPELAPVQEAAGVLQAEPATVTFFVV